MKQTMIAVILVSMLSAATAYATPTDTEFATKAARDGATEVAIGKLAQNNGANSSVRQFGEKMVADHSKAGADLKAAAASDDIAIPAAAMSANQTMVDKLAHLQGAAFDKQYAQMMVEDHEKAVALFKQESETGTGELKAFAARTLPTLEMHLEMAKAIQTGDNSSSLP